jgi:hypothetical protein
MLRETNIGDLLRFARAYRKLGDAVQEQVHDLFDGTDDDLNPNAVAAIRSNLGRFHPEIKAACDAWDLRNAKHDDSQEPS